jgi:hypothetical protein
MRDKKNGQFVSKISRDSWLWGLYRGGHKEYDILGYAVWFGGSPPKFRKNVSTPSSASNSKQSKKLAISKQQAEHFAYALRYVGELTELHIVTRQMIIYFSWGSYKSTRK